MGGTRGSVAEPRSLGRLLNIGGFGDRPWHRQHRVHLDHCGQAARAQAGARPPAGARHGAGHEDTLAALFKLGHRAHRSAVFGPRAGDLRARRDPDRWRAVPAWQEHLRDPREPRGGGGAFSGKVQARFASVLIQVVIIDMVFSLDSVITAVGMVDQVSVMIAAVTVAILIMLVSA